MVDHFFFYVDNRPNSNKSTSSSSKRDKIILRAGKFNFYDWVEGRGRFVANRCPIADCLLTSDTERYKTSADALVISEMNWSRLQQHLPKPRHQVLLRQLFVLAYWANVSMYGQSRAVFRLPPCTQLNSCVVKPRQPEVQKNRNESSQRFNLLSHVSLWVSAVWIRQSLTILASLCYYRIWAQLLLLSTRQTHALSKNWRWGVRTARLWFHWTESENYFIPTPTGFLRLYARRRGVSTSTRRLL